MKDTIIIGRIVQLLFYFTKIIAYDCGLLWIFSYLKKSVYYFPNHEATVLDCDSWRKALKIVWSFLARLMETD